MTFLGLVGHERPAAARGGRVPIETCERAGIKPVLITGDHALTAEAVARELGMLKRGRIVTGAELDAMSDEELSREVEEHRGLRPRLAGPQAAGGTAPGRARATTSP